jgi:putative membrane protein
MSGILLASLTASLHYLALALGAGGVFVRGRLLARIAPGPVERDAARSILLADAFWALAALLWLSTGLARLFGGWEKGAEWYLHHPLFWLKTALFGAVLLLELEPMVTLMGWRLALRHGGTPSVEAAALRRVVWLNRLEVMLVPVIVVVAGAMARGIGY